MLLSFLSKILFHALGIIFNVELDDGCLKKVSKSQVLKMAIFGRNLKTRAQVQFLTDFNKKYHFGLRKPFLKNDRDFEESYQSVFGVNNIL